MGGEKKPTPSAAGWPLGSPPRGRGKVLLSMIFFFALRITPAWAGKSPDPPTPPTSGGDHPRVGGEKLLAGVVPLKEVGSPPRGRGKVLLSMIFFFALRITPAWAGKSPDPPTPPTSGGDHPRVGGEKLLAGVVPLKEVGSPPRGRGKVSAGGARTVNGRITPAGAGKRRSGTWITARCRDHPRRGGEKQATAYDIKAPPGSPPQGRGKETGAVKRKGGYGITPAGAGKSQRKRRICSIKRDHPRRGGEKLDGVHFHDGRIGSPPQGRGKD